jgi:hypothetical protein
VADNGIEILGGGCFGYIAGAGNNLILEKRYENSKA